MTEHNHSDSQAVDDFMDGIEFLAAAGSGRNDQEPLEQVGTEDIVCDSTEPSPGRPGVPVLALEESEWFLPKMHSTIYADLVTDQGLLGGLVGDSSGFPQDTVLAGLVPLHAASESLEFVSHAGFVPRALVVIAERGAPEELPKMTEAEASEFVNAIRLAMPQCATRPAQLTAIEVARFNEGLAFLEASELENVVINDAQRLAFALFYAALIGRADRYGRRHLNVPPVVSAIYLSWCDWPPAATRFWVGVGTAGCIDGPERRVRRFIAQRRIPETPDGAVDGATCVTWRQMMCGVLEGWDYERGLTGGPLDGVCEMSAVASEET